MQDVVVLRSRRYFSSQKMDPQDSDKISAQKQDNSKKQGRKPQPKSQSVTKKISKKRGPPRPHKKLDQAVLESRVTKLQRRIDRASGQLQDAQRHIDGYHREIVFRHADAAPEPAA